jgi:hypothetical protein
MGRAAKLGFTAAVPFAYHGQMQQSDPSAPDDSDNVLECLDCDGVFRSSAMIERFNERAQAVMSSCPFCGAGWPELIPSSRTPN